LPVEGIQGQVLVTGGGGFIGSRLVEALLERCRVKVLDVNLGRLAERKNENLEFVGIGSDHLRGGFADPAVVEHAISGVDVVYHLAINWDGASWKHALPLADLFSVNIRGVLNLLEAARKQSVRHFIFASSCAVYGESALLAADEETTCKPELWDGDPGPAYGIMKLTTERLCLMYNRTYGLPVTAFRIDFVFDEEEGIPSGWILDELSKDGAINVIEEDGYTAVHVDEVVQAFFQATLNEKAYGQVFNVSNPNTYVSYSELFQTLIQATGSKKELSVIPSPIRKGPVSLSADKIQKALGWKPQKKKEDLLNAIARSIRH
jgi:nucleoside-diphosphate-sugar epimerase